MQRVNSSLAMNDDWVTPLSNLAHMCPHFSSKDGEQQPQEIAGFGEDEGKGQCPFLSQHSTEQQQQNMNQEQVEQKDIKRSRTIQRFQKTCIDPGGPGGQPRGSRTDSGAEKHQKNEFFQNFESIIFFSILGLGADF